MPEVSVEEFIEGEEFTFDTICAGRRASCSTTSAWYRPRPLIARQLEWISPQTIALRDPDAPELAAAARAGRGGARRRSASATGFTHMEWFLKADGEAVFGEIGARPPGARARATS